MIMSIQSLVGILSEHFPRYDLTICYESPIDVNGEKIMNGFYFYFGLYLVL